MRHEAVTTQLFHRCLLVVILVREWHVRMQHAGHREGVSRTRRGYQLPVGGQSFGLALRARYSRRLVRLVGPNQDATQSKHQPDGKTVHYWPTQHL